jgi:hypothetical protein
VTTLTRSLVLGCSIIALSACGADDLGSPGSNGDINIGNIGGGGTPTPTPTPTSSLVTPAATCPDLGTADGLLNNGTISGPTGEYRVCTLPSVFTADATLPYVKGVLYEMNGRVDVGRDDGPTTDASDGITGSNVDLAIAPGAILYGRENVSGGSYIVVQRGSKMLAEGTVERPIIFTAQDDVTGDVQDDSSGLWGGVVLLGRAPVSDCFSGGINQADQTRCQMRVEGIANNIPFFGGNTPNDSSGSLKYVQIRYSGFTLDLGGELQSLTLGGVGASTQLDYIQSYNSSDDGTEFFGGRVNLRHFVAVGAEDDSIDTDSGVQAQLQNILVVQRDNVGDRALENDSPPDDKGPGTTLPDALPRTLTEISNFTFWATSTADAINVRGASDVTLANGVIYKPSASGRSCLSNNGNVGAGRASLIRLFSIELDCVTNAATTAAIAAGNGTANQFQTNSIEGKYLNGANETNFSPIYDASTFGAFFMVTNYVGAVARPTGSETAWTRGWTCDSTVVSFNSGVSCKSLPVYN